VASLFVSCTFFFVILTLLTCYSISSSVCCSDFKTVTFSLKMEHYFLNVELSLTEDPLSNDLFEHMKNVKVNFSLSEF
jgi:hypothetical protein